ncbi:hypothetical protein [Acidaminococcus massiliensis]|uniref:hypothetical protein n=1 Tax=Acidaminococcus massiliensis TaxID=1852375 RepID=UPI0022E3DF38|nr:hypothetical protein [Acidaminococcus massiliensis]
MNEVDICNLALNFLGKGIIKSLSENTELARTCKLHYDRYRRILLKDYSWEFAERTMKLEPVADFGDNVKGWDYVYRYPDDCLQVLKIYDGDDRRKDDKREKFFVQTVDYRLGTKVICCNLENAYMDYVSNEEDCNYFSEEFVEALAHYLAYGMAQALTGSEAKAQTELQYMQNALYQAKLRTAREREHEPSLPHKYFDGRF